MELVLFISVFVIMGALVIFGIFLGEPSVRETVVTVSPNDALYYEAHVTIEPLWRQSDILRFESLVNEFKFKAATLLMRKERLTNLERSDKDAFCTGHGKEFSEVHNRTLALVEFLKSSGFSVWRYKIEAILLDVKLQRTSTRSVLVDTGLSK